jgi:hypothetical protein
MVEMHGYNLPHTATSKSRSRGSGRACLKHEVKFKDLSGKQHAAIGKAASLGLVVLPRTVNHAAILGHTLA